MCFFPQFVSNGNKYKIRKDNNTLSRCYFLWRPLCQASHWGTTWTCIRLWRRSIVLPKMGTHGSVTHPLSRVHTPKLTNQRLTFHSGNSGVLCYSPPYFLALWFLVWRPRLSTFSLSTKDLTGTRTKLSKRQTFIIKKYTIKIIWCLRRGTQLVTRKLVTVSLKFSYSAT